MKGCLHPGCNGASGRGRLLCTAHWINLPAEIKAKVRLYLSTHNWESARICLKDYYDGQEARNTWQA